MSPLITDSLRRLITLFPSTLPSFCPNFHFFPSSFTQPKLYPEFTLNIPSSPSAYRATFTPGHSPILHVALFSPPSLHFFIFHLLPSSILVTLSPASSPQMLLPAPYFIPPLIPVILMIHSCLCFFQSLLPTVHPSLTSIILPPVFLYARSTPIYISQCLSASLLLSIHSERWLY